MYSLAACWLNKSERRRVNGFQNRCLRTIWGIKPAYISRVSNASVLQTTGERPLTCALQRHQLLLFGRVARKPDGHPMRDVTFCPGTLHPATDRYVRKIGRPRLDWAGGVLKLALEAAGSLALLEQAVQDDFAWRSIVEAYVHR